MLEFDKGRIITYQESGLLFLNIVWHIGDELDAAWNELPVSVIQAQFNSMPNWVRTILTVKGGSCFY